MAAIIAFIGSRIGKIVSAIVAGAALLFGAIQYGKRQERTARREDDLEDYIETKKEIEDVEISPTLDAAVDRLRSNRWTR